MAERTLPEQEVAEPMFRLLLLAAREVERRRSWELPLAYFAFWTVKLGGYLPPLERCTTCGQAFGDEPAFHFAQAPGLSCEKCRKPVQSKPGGRKVESRARPEGDRDDDDERRQESKIDRDDEWQQQPGQSPAHRVASSRAARRVADKAENISPAVNRTRLSARVAATGQLNETRTSS